MGLEGCIGGKVKTEDFYLAHIYHGPKIHVLHGDGNDFVADTVEINVESGGVSGDGFREAEGTTVVGDAEVMLKMVDNKTFPCKREQPNGLDLYINRGRDYVIKALALHDFLGERNRELTLNDIKFEVNRVKAEVINTYDICKDIEYSVEKKSADTVDIHITKLLFDGIITEIDVYVTVEVE